MKFILQVKTQKAGLVFQVPVPDSGNVIHVTGGTGRAVQLSWGRALYQSEPEELPDSWQWALVALEMTGAHI